MNRTLEPEVMDTADVVLAYEAMDHAGPSAAIVGRMRELGAGGLTLDLGCGPGHIAAAVVEQIAGTIVVGVDLSTVMLRLAARRWHAQTRYILADIKRLPFGPGSFDAVYSNTTLHHLPDPRPMLAEACRVLRPGGVLLIRDLYRPPTAARRDELVATHAPPDVNTPLQRQLLSDSLQAALTPQELLVAAREVGIEGAEVTVDTDRHMTLQAHRRDGKPPGSESRIPAMAQAVNDLIAEAVRRAIPDAEVFADSPDGRHFQAVVVSDTFRGMPLVRQHQLVMKALRAEFDSDRLHAMQLKTMTPEQRDSHARPGHT